MAEDLKAYQPLEISDTPFPVEGGEPPAAATLAAGQDAYTPKTIQDKAFPVKRVAVELLSTALNTRSKKILQEFQFTESGALQVGKYEDGVSGDIRISPAGITARDSAGITTFALDGDSGDAVFKGQIRSGSLVTGEVIVGNNSVIIDGLNRRIIVNDGTDDRVLIGFQEDGF